MEEFDILSSPGNIGFYQSCDVTEIYLITTPEVTNIFTLVVFQDKCRTQKKKKFIGEMIKFDNSSKVGIIQYELTIPEIRARYEELSNSKRWDEKAKQTVLKRLPKQFVSTKDDNALNKVLKNNFDNGSYLIEFFDENKDSTAQILEYTSRKNFDQLCTTIASRIPIFLTGLPDRIGNILFQFPVTIADISSTAMESWNGNILNFAWNASLGYIPNCRISITEMLDNNII
ncbi:MAG: hypothetical protein ACN6PI_12210, partial [Sphingobacterium siyangense]